ncbi:MAG: hypothetical protein RL518_1239 [Pseudomonadota bacterium]|jgi:hypothetical protein
MVGRNHVPYVLSLAGSIATIPINLELSLPKKYEGVSSHTEPYFNMLPGEHLSRASEGGLPVVR